MASRRIDRIDQLAVNGGLMLEIRCGENSSDPQDYSQEGQEIYGLGLGHRNTLSESIFFVKDRWIRLSRRPEGKRS